MASADRRIVRALSVRQPWAHLIVTGHKDIENRTRRTHHRGPILIHASLKLAEDVEGLRERCERLGILLPDQFDRGGIVGYARIVECVSEHASPWFSGPFGWVLEGAGTLPFRPLSGMLGLFPVTLTAEEAHVVPAEAAAPV